MSASKAFALWLKQTGLCAASEIIALPGDASARRYYRIQHASGSFIALDASAEKASCAPFVAVADMLTAAGLSVPQVYAMDDAAGFLLLTDFGDQRYLEILSSSQVAQAEKLYGRALDALIILQRCQPVKHALPFFDEAFILREMHLFVAWFLENYLHLSLSRIIQLEFKKLFQFFVDVLLSQPQVVMHRDYHSANLMLLAEEKVGILDFQDAVWGPPVYDLVSLLRDCYIAWPEAQVEKWALHFADQSGWLQHTSAENFLYWFDIVGIQRHLKALMIFARKWCRDQNANYLKHIPRTLQYLRCITAKYPECYALNQFLQHEVTEKCEA